MAPSPAPHERPSAIQSAAPASVAPTANSATSPAARRSSSASKPAPAQASAQRSGSISPRAVPTSGKASPSGASKPEVNIPKVVIKKEPGSPTIGNARPRPRKLDLSKNTLNSNAPASALPMTARDGLGIQEVGLACLSPGFVTQNPVMKEQLQRSLSVREQQRHIIEARLQQQSAKGDGTHPDRDGAPQFSAKTPGLSSHRRRAPPGLSIVAPSHEQFANERVIQSAPLGHSFTGRHHPAPLSRHIPTQPGHGSQSHIHPVPATQTTNRLPPIHDVFPHGQHADNHSSTYGSASRAPLASPGHPHSAYPAPLSARPREYKSAEEAQQELAGGRPELLPKIVHYGGHQPPTPPSPVGGRISSNNRRRNRAEYEDGASPPLGHGPASSRRGPFGAGRDSPESQRAKREEFLRLCERAWDLFHS
ncbi:hypothetical protein ISF_01357 [Cordyceps fumosorosea ARSEF 2679]|uniref:Uncharacterized protein n=1 Tax=Cordyceps fumosorosea (strain ARSEF 2679) TaxID=1081104 RepID=A0A162LLB3_CORFA|nr:hypothetical protein ISF_01357 [Cordyceps fumosorosea ARSEF 2679]OAA72284.1 hypothetical protein ISF_01357 [Cordyceps fumosorosea ARSEF 2679]